jgi:hypothetical protein
LLPARLLVMAQVVAQVVAQVAEPVEAQAAFARIVLTLPC